MYTSASFFVLMSNLFFQPDKVKNYVCNVLIYYLSANEDSSDWSMTPIDTSNPIHKMKSTSPASSPRPVGKSSSKGGETSRFTFKKYLLPKSAAVGVQDGLPTRYPCPICGEYFQADKITDHSANCYTDETLSSFDEESCPICGKRIQKSLLSDHAQMCAQNIFG